MNITLLWKLWRTNLPDLIAPEGSEPRLDMRTQEEVTYTSAAAAW